MTEWNSKSKKELWWKDVKLPRTKGFYQRLECEARQAAEYYTSYVKAWRAIQPLLDFFKEDEAALTAIRRGFNTSPQNGGWLDLPDYEEVHNPTPTSRILDNRAKKIVLS